MRYIAIRPSKWIIANSLQFHPIFFFAKFYSLYNVSLSLPLPAVAAKKKKKGPRVEKQRTKNQWTRIEFDRENKRS